MSNQIQKTERFFSSSSFRFLFYSCSFHSISYVYCIIFLVNNYEINHIACSYLGLWLKDTTVKFITLNMVTQYFDPAYHKLIQYLYPKNVIEWNEFFIFTCIFIFCEPLQLFQFILTLSKIYSHLYVSVDQINEFNSVISLCNAEKNNLYQFLASYKYVMSEYLYLYIIIVIYIVYIKKHTLTKHLYFSFRNPVVMRHLSID